MMNGENLNNLIDLIYENDEVEGVAVADIAGNLIENQLPVPANTASVISVTVAQITSGLSQSQRTLKGFLFKAGDSVLQVGVFSEYIIIMQLITPFSANKVEKNVRSIFGSQTVKVANSVTLPQAATPEIITEEPVGGVNFTDFNSQLSKLLRPIAPSAILKKMIQKGYADEGIASDSVEISKEQAISVGTNIIDKIPNASRRKIIENEFQTIISKL